MDVCSALNDSPPSPPRALAHDSRDEIVRLLQQRWGRRRYPACYNSDFIEDFIDRIDAHGVVPLAPDEVGTVVTAFAVVAGGHGRIVLLVEAMIVRLTVHGGVWFAEHLVVRGAPW